MCLVAANCAGLCLVKLYSLCVLCKGSGEKKKNEERRKEGKELKAVNICGRKIKSVYSSQDDIAKF